MVRAIPLLLLLLPAGCGEEPGPPLLWSVQAQGAPPSYLLGTMHIGVSARDHLPRSVWDAFDAADRLVEEAEIRYIDGAQYLQLAGMPTSQGLDQLLPADVWSALTALLSDVSLERLRSLRPWAAASLVFNKLVPAVEGMDLTFLDAADAAGKPLVFLEVWQDQANAMNQIPLADDADSLAELVQQRQAYTARLERLIALYRKGDVEGVFALAPEAGAIPAPGSSFFDTFIVARNAKWLPALEQQLKSGGAFVAVGFGHVIGPQGLVQTLSGRGYSVSRVR